MAFWLLQRAKQEGAIQEEIFENERYLPIRGWASGCLLPTERRRYSTRNGSQSFNDFPTMHLPPGQRWNKMHTLTLCGPLATGCSSRSG